MRFDLNEKGLRRIFRDWQVKALEYMWSIDNILVKSVDVWNHLKGIHAVADPNSLKSVSRASVINFLNQMVDEKLMMFDFGTGKGGTHRVYSFKPELDTQAKFKAYIHTLFYDALNDFLNEE